MIDLLWSRKLNMSLDSLLMSSHAASEDVSAWLFCCGHWHWLNIGAVLDFCCFASFVEAGCWEARNAKQWGHQWWTVHGHRYDRYVKIVFCLQLWLVDLWWAMVARYVLAVSLDMQAAAVCYHFSIGGGSYVGCQGGRGSHDRERIVNQADSLSVQGCT